MSSSQSAAQSLGNLSSMSQADSEVRTLILAPDFRYGTKAPYVSNRDSSPNRATSRLRRPPSRAEGDGDEREGSHRRTTFTTVPCQDRNSHKDFKPVGIAGNRISGLDSLHKVPIDFERQVYCSLNLSIINHESCKSSLLPAAAPCHHKHTSHQGTSEASKPSDSGVMVPSINAAQNLDQQGIRTLRSCDVWTFDSATSWEPLTEGGTSC